MILHLIAISFEVQIIQAKDMIAEPTRLTPLRQFSPSDSPLFSNFSDAYPINNENVAKDKWGAAYKFMKNLRRSKQSSGSNKDAI